MCSVNTFFSGDFFFPVKKIIKRNFFFFHFWPNEFSFFSFFFRRRIFCVEKKKISLFQFIFFSVCWISISSVSAASSSHSLSRRPNKNTGGRRKCLFLAQKLVCDKHLPVFTAITLQNYSLRWSSGELGSTHTQKSQECTFFSCLTHEKKNLLKMFFCIIFVIEQILKAFVFHRLYFRNFTRNRRCKQMISLVLAHSSFLQHSCSLSSSLSLSDNNQSKLWSTRVRLLQQHHEMQMSIRRPSRVDVQLPQR